ncbi:MAG: DUF4091 domain-containing protein [Acidobacteriota bacterium]|nr:DUF4091 domain-containing protein [Acidobacteriota bacterium]
MKQEQLYQLSLDFPLSVDLYREWFHLNKPDGMYYPDALVPAHMPYRSHLPEPDNRVPKQTVQSFWVDIWIPATAEPGIYRGQAQLTSGSGRRTLPVEIDVLPAVLPDKDALTLDSNSYGTSWMLSQYPETLARLRSGNGGEDELFQLIHRHHQMFYDHRGTFHQLGYGHAGKVAPEFAPALSGSGKTKHVANWDWFDRHYGPLLDGSAFKDSRRGARPIPYMYLPVNPEWPASFLWWGQPGYKAEFQNVLAEMESHFREKNWTSTTFEVFFNHKKRYKGFPSDGDEIRFPRDNRYLLQYHRLLQAAIPPASPVHFVMRADTSWTMAQQFELLKGAITFWVAGEGVLSWYPDSIGELKQRGDTVWAYGGTPTVEKVSTAITLNPLRSWIAGVNGFVRWQTVDPGPDPWFALTGGGETLVYPGERFGVAGPLASIRLKLQRNCLQDLALLESASAHSSLRAIQDAVVQRFNGTHLSDWRNTRPALLKKPVLDWNNADIEDALKPYEAKFAVLDPNAWLRVREFAQETGHAK